MSRQTAVMLALGLLALLLVLVWLRRELRRGRRDSEPFTVIRASGEAAVVTPAVPVTPVVITRAALGQRSAAASAVPTTGPPEPYEHQHYPDGAEKLSFPTDHLMKGSRQLTGSFVEVAGVFFYEQAFNQLWLGSQRAVELVPEPQNPHDANAVQVVASWVEGARSVRHVIGHLPADVAAGLANERPSDLPLKVALARMWRGSVKYEVKVAIYEPGAHSEYWRIRGGVPDRLHRL